MASSTNHQNPRPETTHNRVEPLKPSGPITDEFAAAMTMDVVAEEQAAYWDWAVATGVGAELLNRWAGVEYRRLQVIRSCRLVIAAAWRSQATTSHHGLAARYLPHQLTGEAHGPGLPASSMHT
jgi:hypothetical protein